MTLQQYITKIDVLFKTGNAREHSYSGDLQNLIMEILPDVLVTNETQYFANVPEVAWNFYIGGYQPAQKWLKDRKGRELNYDDILHYQKIIVTLTETDRLMKEINRINI
jgi:hypothetical protein